MRNITVTLENSVSSKKLPSFNITTNIFTLLTAKMYIQCNTFFLFVFHNLTSELQENPRYKIIIILTF